MGDSESPPRLTFGCFVEIPDPFGNPFAFNIGRVIALSPLVGEALTQAPEGCRAWVLLEDGVKVASPMPYESIIQLIAYAAQVVRAEPDHESDLSTSIRDALLSP